MPERLVAGGRWLTGVCVVALAIPALAQPPANSGQKKADEKLRRQLGEKEYQKFLEAQARGKPAAKPQPISLTPDETALFTAAAGNKPEAAAALLDKGVNIHIKNKDQRTPLMVAATSGHREVVDLLLAKGANIDDVDDMGTSLWWSANSGKVQDVEWLLDKGADINKAVTESPIGIAAINGHAECVQLLISRGSANSMFSAAYLGDSKVLSLLLNANPRLAKLSVRVADGAVTPLHLATAQGHAEAVELLLSAGADPWLKGRDKLTAVQLTPTVSILKHYLAKQNFLKSAVSAELVTRFLTTGRPELAQYLMEQGELPTNAVRLLLDLDLEKDKAALQLLKANGAFNAVNDAGKTALALAICDIQGAPVGIFGEPGEVTVKTDRPRALWLIEQGYPIDKIYRANPSGDQTCALNDAIRNGDLEVLEALLEHGVNLTPETRKVDLPGGRSVEEPTNCPPPLYVAAMLGKREIAELLVERGVDVNAAIPKSGYTPLHIAANNNHPEIVELLLSKGADPHAKSRPVVNSDGKETVETPLQLAKAKGYTEIVKMLSAKR